MARPSGHKLNRPAWDDLLNIRGLTITEVARIADIPRASISSLVGYHHGASNPIAHRIASALDCHPATLFPTLGSKFEASADEAAA